MDEKQEKKSLEECSKELEETKALVDDYANHLKRLQAEFENYVKRVEKERVEINERVSERVIIKLLTIVDDFERALKQLKNIPEETRKGIEIIFKNIHKVLDEENVKPIKSVGEKLDPYKHEVVLQVESDAPEETIVEELQKGYMMNDRVIRYSKVKVSKGPGGNQNG